MKFFLTDRPIIGILFVFLQNKVCDINAYIYNNVGTRIHSCYPVKGI